MNHFLPEKCVTRPSIFNWLWWGSHQKSAKGRSFPFSYLCKKYIISINGILAFCSYVIMDSQKPILGWYYSSKTYIHAIWIHFFNKLLRKTQISLGIRPVWSESLLCAQWVAKGSVLLQADSEDSDQTGRMHRLICLRWAHSQDSWKQKPGLHGRNLSSTYFHDFYTRWKSLKRTPFLDVIKQCRKTHKLRKR